MAYDLTGTRRRSSAPAAASSTIVRTATPCSRSRTTRRSPPRRTFATASCRRSIRGLSMLPVPGMTIFQYEAKVPAQWQWQVGVQRALPWSMVDRHLLRRQPRLQPARRLPGRLAGQPERGRLRCGVSAAEPGSDDRARARFPAPNAYTTNLLRPYRGLRQHQPEHDRVLGHVSLAADVAEPPVPQRVLVRCELHLRASR